MTDQPRTSADPDRACPHENFDAYVAVNRLTVSDDDPTVRGYSADIRVNCRDCDEPFRWTGLPAGLSPAHPMCNIDETVLSAPLRPASADPDFGLGLPGYAVRAIPTDGSAAATLERARQALADLKAAGGPPLGTSVARWLDKQLIPLDTALNDPTEKNG